MEIKKLHPGILILIFIFMLVDPLFMNWLFKIHFFRPIAFATNYILQPTLLAGLCNILFFSVLIFILGKHDFRSIWLTKEKAKMALPVLLYIWLSAQIIPIAFVFFSKGDILLIDNLNIAIGRWLGQLFGNAPFEELIFRGIFFLQFYLLFQSRTSNKNSIILAVMLSQLLFAVSHVPNRIWINKVDNLATEIIGLFIAGVGLTLIFIHTQNLLFVIGIHALSNFPFPLVKTDFPIHYYSTYILVLLAAIFWNKITSSRPGESLLSIPPYPKNRKPNLDENKR